MRVLDDVEIKVAFTEREIQLIDRALYLDDTSDNDNRDLFDAFNAVLCDSGLVELR